MARTKRPTRSETKKATASTPARPADDIAVALLGLKNSATKKGKKKTSNASTRRKLVKTPSKRRKKTPTKLNRGSARKTKKTPRSSSAKKNPFKTPKTTKSKKQFEIIEKVHRDCTVFQLLRWLKYTPAFTHLFIMCCTLAYICL